MKFFPTIVAALVITLFLSACDRAEPVTYTIPKEAREVTLPTQGPEPAPASSEKEAPNNMRVLPGMAEAAQAAPELSYTVPQGWEEFPPQSIRKANFKVSDESGRAELAVTVFPNMSGNMLGNINRWRGQIGLDPIQEGDIQTVVTPFVISNHSGTLIDLQGPEQSMLVGMLPFHGNTWFFKLQGNKGTVVAERANMEKFLKSVAIQDNHH